MYAGKNRIHKMRHGSEPHGGRVDLKGADGKGDGSSPFGLLPCIGVDPEICPDDDEQHDDGNPRHPTKG